MKSRVVLLLGVAGAMVLLCLSPSASFAFTSAARNSANYLQPNVNSARNDQNMSYDYVHTWRSGDPGTSEKVIYSFSGKDGSGPNDLIAGSAGNLYGTTFDGGPGGAGTVFRLSPHDGAWIETILYSFSYRRLGDGIGPKAGLVMDHLGNLFGSTWLGGPTGGGLVFELSPPVQQQDKAWNYRIIYDFSAPNDGSSPEAPLTMDGDGNLYGTTASGGTGGCAGGCGIVFKLSPPKGPSQKSWTETILYNFPGSFEVGGGTTAGVTFGANGDVYGTTIYGGGYPYGTVFRLSPPKDGGKSWSHSVVYAFKGGSDGAVPMSGVVFDKYGILYGTTASGGTSTQCYGVSCGTIFELTPTSSGYWTHFVLYTFAGGSDGGYPMSSLTLDGRGNIYGTTLIGGDQSCDSGDGCGTIYELHQVPWGVFKETILHRFTGGNGGVGPGGLIFGLNDNLYGVGAEGAHGAGLVFEVQVWSTSWTEFGS